MILFAVGSYINEAIYKTGNNEAIYKTGNNEVIYKTGNIEKEGIVRYIILSLFLAMGVGMISGSTQHFFDTPVYASYLMPAGVFIASLAFALRNNYELSKKTWTKLLVAGVVFAAVLFAILNSYAKSIPTSEVHGHGAASIVSDQKSHAEPDTHHGDSHESTE